MRFFLLLLLTLLFVDSAVSAQTAESDSLFSIGVSLYEHENYNEAITVFTLCDSIDNINPILSSGRKHYSKMWVSSCLYKTGNIIQACELAPITPQTGVFLDGNYSCDLAPIDRRRTIKSDSISEIAYKLFLDAKYKEALPLYINCLKMQRQELDSNSLWIANTLSQCGYCCEKKGDYTRALEFFLKSASIYGKIRHFYYKNICRDVVKMFAYLNDTINAVDFGVKSFRQCLNIQDKFDKNSMGNSYSSVFLQHLQPSLFLGENYVDTILLNVSNKIIEQCCGTLSPEYSDYLVRKGEYLSYMPKFNNQAIEYLEEANNICLKIHKNNDWGNYCLARAHFNKRNYYDALKVLCRCLNICKYEYKNKIFSLYADCNLHLGQYGESILYYQKVVDETENVYNQTIKNVIDSIMRIDNYDYEKDYPEIAMDNNDVIWLYLSALQNLGHAYYLSNDIENAIQTQKKIVSIENYTESITGRFDSLFELGKYYATAGQVKKSIEMHQEIIKNDTARLIQNDLMAYRLSCLAEEYYTINNVDSALFYGEKVMCHLKELYGTKHPEYLENMYQCAKYYAKVEKNECANEYLDLYYNGIKNHIVNNMVALPSYMCRSFWNQYYKKFMNGIHQSIDVCNNTKYDAIVFAKGLLLYTEVLSQNQEKHIDVNNRDILNYNYIYNHTLTSNELSGLDNINNLFLSTKDIITELKDSDIVIDFFVQEIDQDSTLWIAALLKKNYEGCKYIPLYTQKKIDSLLSKYDQSLLSSLLWAPLTEELKCVKNIYFSPSGDLYKIAVENLPSPDGNGLMADHYNMYRLSSTRELALDKTKVESKDAAIYGGMQYSTDVTALEDNARLYASVTRSDESLYNPYIDSLGVKRDDRKDPFKGLYLNPLPNAKVEATSITKTINDAHMKDFVATVYTDAAATETSFKALSGQKKRVIHVATHGFYYKEEDAEKFKDIMPQLQLDDRFAHRYIEDKQLTRSGLYFAGADNKRLGVEIPEGIDDGILTAQEISMLDLRGCDLVVLSACQTAQGDIGADGVFGLQRAFKKAGVNSILMSIDKIDDRATQLLMTEFYRNYVKGISKQESLKRAQKYLREKTEYKDSEYWSSFILLDALD